MSYFVYILRTSSSTLYIGQTNNLEKRLKDHQSKSSRSAKYVRYFDSTKLVYSEKYLTRKEAMQREVELKKWPKAKKEAIIVGNMEGKDKGISYVKQAVRGVDEMKVDSKDWPEEREKMIKSLHDEAGDANFRHAIEDLRFDVWDKPESRKARFIAKAAEMYDIPFGKASKRRLAGK